MKLAVIPMFGNLSDLGLFANTSQYHMALTHLVEYSPTYAQFYREKSDNGDFVILDNSLIEMGESMQWSRVVMAALKIRANEVVLPDVMMDGAGTIGAVRRALNDDVTNLIKDTRKMAVCHGEDLEEFLNVYKILTTMDDIHTIGIPKAVVKFGVGTRTDVLRLMLTKGYLGDGQNGKAIHLLGANGPEDFVMPQHVKYYIRGIDTVYPIWMAHNNILLEPKPEMNPIRPAGSIAHESTKVTHKIKAMTNIAVCLGWTHE